MTREQVTGPAPAVTLKAIGHGRELTFNALGTPAVVMCVARESADQPNAVVDVPTQIQVIESASVADIVHKAIPAGGCHARKTGTA